MSRSPPIANQTVDVICSTCCWVGLANWWAISSVALLASFQAGAAANVSTESKAQDEEALARERGIQEGSSDDTIIVYGRAVQQIGVARSGSQGTIGYADFENLPISRTGELVENVPGVIATQHSGTGKANQYFLRGFNLDHGTDFADVGDYSPAGTIAFKTYDTLEPFAQATLGMFGYYRATAAGSAPLASGNLLVANGAFGGLKLNASATYYDLMLTSNFTYFPDDPANGDEFQQADRRAILGGTASQRWEMAGMPLPLVLTVGGSVRYERIDRVGLFRSVEDDAFLR